MKKLLFFISVLTLGLTACSESDGTAEEFVDWQNRNETYFEQQYQAHNAANIIKKWSVEQSVEVAHTDCILVDRLAEGSGSTTPYFTDTVSVHYRGHLIPSVSYPAGYEFDKSWVGTFDTAVSVPTKFSLNSSLVVGFSTALLHMHRGDRWRVTVPYQLGYGTTAQSTIPAYSTLIFEIELVDFWSEKKGDRY